MPRMMSKNVFQNRLIDNGKDGLVTEGEKFECSDDLAKDYERLGFAERIDGSTSDQVEEQTAEHRPVPDALTGLTTTGETEASAGIVPEPQLQPDPAPMPDPVPVAEPVPEPAPTPEPQPEVAAEQIPPAHVDEAPARPSAEQPVALNEDGTDVTAPIDPAQDASKADKAAKVPANKKAAEPVNKAATDATTKAAE